MASPSLVAQTFVGRWRRACADLLAPAAILAGAWLLYAVPGALRDGHRGMAFAAQIVGDPGLSLSLLVLFVGLVHAQRLAGRLRTLGILAAAVGAAALSQIVGIAFMTTTGLWTRGAWSIPTLWWANFGSVAMICVGAAFIEDYRARSKARAAALRDARLRAAEMVRRTAEVRLQAARARIEPRFLFDALSAVERAYDADADAAAGNALLDSLVAYLRAVLPDLREASPSADRDAEIARLRLNVERAIGSAQAGTVDAQS